MTSALQTHRKLLMILPSLRLSGGILEALRLVEDLQRRSIDVEIVVLWRTENELRCPGFPVVYLSPFRTSDPGRPLQALYIVASFLRFLCKDALFGKRRSIAILLTHFSTFPFGWLVPWADRYCFNQDIEWMFVPEGLPRRLLRSIILTTSRRSSVVTTNAYVDGLYRDQGIRSVGQATIWAREQWLLPGEPVDRDVDVVAIVRRGHMKRLDLYQSVLARLRQMEISTLAVAPDPDIHGNVLPLVTHAILRPTNDELRDIYHRSKIFLLLSDTEGFSLPPLEAMGAGCVPLCRDSGGPRCYMDGSFAAHLIPLEADADEIVRRVQSLLDDRERLAALSAEAKRRFADGLASSQQQRSDCMDALAQRLRLP